MVWNGNEILLLYNMFILNWSLAFNNRLTHPWGLQPTTRRTQQHIHPIHNAPVGHRTTYILLSI